MSTQERTWPQACQPILQPIGNGCAAEDSSRNGVPPILPLNNGVSRSSCPDEMGLATEKIVFHVKLNSDGLEVNVMIWSTVGRHDREGLDQNSSFTEPSFKGSHHDHLVSFDGLCDDACHNCVR